MEKDNPTPPVSTESVPRPTPRRDGPFHVELISIGRDLLRGQASDTNARTLATTLSRRGALVHRMTIVDDKPEAIAAALRESLARHPHLVISTGGLGPASDDHTVEAMSAALSRPLVENAGAREQVEAAYRRMIQARQVMGSGMTLAREKLCRLPMGATALSNEKGIAPGVLLRLPGGATVVGLPGRPSEMESSWSAALEALNDVLPKGASIRREVEAPTADESELRELLELLSKEHPGVWLSTRPAGARRNQHRAVISLEAVADDSRQATTLVEAALQRLLQLAQTSRHQRSPSH